MCYQFHFMNLEVSGTWDFATKAICRHLADSTLFSDFMGQNSIILKGYKYNPSI